MSDRPSTAPLIWGAAAINRRGKFSASKVSEVPGRLWSCSLTNFAIDEADDEEDIEGDWANTDGRRNQGRSANSVLMMMMMLMITTKMMMMMMMMVC